MLCCFLFDLHLLLCIFVFFFFKQKTAYEMRISDWSSDVCSSDLIEQLPRNPCADHRTHERLWRIVPRADTDLLRRARQTLDEVLTECIVRHDQSSCAGAALSGRDERGLQHVVNRRIDVFDRSHDQWIDRKSTRLNSSH